MFSFTSSQSEANGPCSSLRNWLTDSPVVGRIMISYLTCLDMEYWGMECCGMSGETTSHNWAGFYVKNDITFIFISTLEEEIRKMPDICLHLITPSLFHVTR